MAFAYKTEEEVIEAGERFERGRYWRHVRSLASDILDQYPYDEDKQQDYLHELADTAVTTTRDAIEAIRFSDHDDAVFDDMGEVPARDNAYDLYAYIAYFAMREDIAEELSRLREERRANPRFEDTEMKTWLERDRAHVELRNSFTNEAIVEWWDDDVNQAIEDGFLKPDDLHRSAYDYAVHTGLIQSTEED